MDVIVEINDLQKVYSKRRGTDVVAVEHLELDLGRRGSVHGFLGPNGSGKTTTIRCLLGLTKPTGGTVRVFGADSTRSFHTVASRIGAVVESPRMFPNFSGRRNLSLLADLAGIEGARVDRVLERVGLADRSQDTFASYSLGMKQRLAIGAALLKDPDLLILDEPANGLDPAGIMEIRRLIREIADDGRAVIVSSHQLAEIEQVCDEVTIIHRGKLVDTGPLERIRAHAGPDQVVVTIDDRMAAIAALAEAGIAAHPRSYESEIVVEVEADRAADVTRALAERGHYLRGLRSVQATLEAAFLNLTGDAPPPPMAPPPTDTPPTDTPPDEPGLPEAEAIDGSEA